MTFLLGGFFVNYYFGLVFFFGSVRFSYFTTTLCIRNIPSCGQVTKCQHRGLIQLMCTSCCSSWRPHLGSEVVTGLSTYPRQFSHLEWKQLHGILFVVWRTLLFIGKGLIFSALYLTRLVLKEALSKQETRQCLLRLMQFCSVLLFMRDICNH